VQSLALLLALKNNKLLNILAFQAPHKVYKFSLSCCISPKPPPRKSLLTPSNCRRALWFITTFNYVSINLTKLLT